MVSYEGVFFDKETSDFIRSLEETKLPIINDEIHCTFKYNPSSKEIFNELINQEIEVTLIGYGCDGKNSGFEITLPDYILPYYINYEDSNHTKLKKPHITASINNGAKPVNTINLEFKPLKEPITIKGKFGFWLKENNKEFVSFEKYEIRKKIKN